MACLITEGLYPVGLSGVFRQLDNYTVKNNSFYREECLVIMRVERHTHIQHYQSIETHLEKTDYLSNCVKSRTYDCLKIRQH